MAADVTDARAAVLDAVRAGDARLRRHALAIELSRASMLAAAIPAAAAVLRVLRPISSTALVAAFVIPAALLGAWALWRLRRHAALERTARVMDRAAGLDDELLSAHWFAAHGPETPWTRAQMGRAAARLATVDWDTLQPPPRPRRALATTAVLLGLTAVLLFVPTGSVTGPAFLNAGDATAGGRDAALELLRSRLQETEMAEADRLRAAEILRALEREALSSQQAQALLAELEALVGRHAPDAKALEAMAAALDTSVSAKELAAALRRQDLAFAATQARALANRAPALGRRERQELADSVDEAAAKGGKSLETLADEMRDAAGRLRGEDSEAMKKSLERMADRMDQMARDRGERGDPGAREETQALEDALGEKGAAADQGQTPGESGRESTQASGSMQGRGAGMAREAAAMPNPSGAPQAATPGLGQMAGQPQGQPSMTAEQAAAARRLEVALREETVRAHDQAAGAKPAELVDRKTGRVDSTVQYRRVEDTQTYDRAAAQQEGAVPEARRAVVKKYFRALGPRGVKK